MKEAVDMNEAIAQEITFLREQVKTLRRAVTAANRQIDHIETRIDDLRRIRPYQPGEENDAK